MCRFCGSLKLMPNEYSPSNIGLDLAENEPQPKFIKMRGSHMAVPRIVPTSGPNGQWGNFQWGIVPTSGRVRLPFAVDAMLIGGRGTSMQHPPPQREERGDGSCAGSAKISPVD